MYLYKLNQWVFYKHSFVQITYRWNYKLINYYEIKFPHMGKMIVVETKLKG